MRNNGLIPSTILLLFIYLASLVVTYKEYLINEYQLEINIYPLLIIVLILLIPSALAALVATRYVTPSGLRLRKLQVGMHRWIGKIYRWLGSGWRSPAVMLSDVIIVFAIVKGVLYLLTDQMLGKVFFDSAIYNANITGTTSAGTNFSWTINNATVSGSLPYLNLNETIFQGFLLDVGSNGGVGLIDGSLALILGTIWLDWEKIAALWILILISKIASDASQRLVVEEVADYTQNSSQDEKASESKEEKQKSKKVAGGLSDLLIVHINRINELYMAVDDKRAIPSECGAGRPIDANIKTEDLSEFLSSEAVGGAQEVTFFGIKIPAGAITGFFGRVIRGPRIVISLHKIDDREDEGRVVLTATMTRNKKSYSWRVDSLEPLDERQAGLEESQAGKIRTKDDMVKELATKIVHHSFSEETSARWKAWYYFNEGLRSYRDGLVSTKDQSYNLKKAEKSFIRALEEANDFALAYYNLGVVYTELRQEEAAEVAFSKAIENNPELSAAYYALGFNQFCKADARLKDVEMIFVKHPGLDIPHEISCQELFWRQRKTFDSAKKSGMSQDDIKNQKENITKYYVDVIRRCDQTIHIAKSKSSFVDRDFNVLAEAYNLKANAQILRDMLESDDHKDKKPDYLVSAEKAVKYSWKALFKAEFENESNNEMILKTIKTVRECSIDFADFCLYYYIDQYCSYKKFVDDAENALKQALSVDPTDANTYFLLGNRYYCSTKFAKSAEFYEKAVQVEPDTCDFWAHLALAYALCDNRSKSITASEKIKFYEGNASYQALEIATLAYQVLIKNIDKQILELEQKLNREKQGLEKQSRQDEQNELKIQKLKILESYKSKMRASMLAKMDQYLREDGQRDIREILYKIYYIKIKLGSSKLNSCKLDDGWTHAQFAIALARLWDKFKEEERHLLKEEDHQTGYLPDRSLCDDEYVNGVLQSGIDFLEQKPDPDEFEWMWLNEQDTLALGCLYYCKSSRSDQKKNKDAFDHFQKVQEEIQQELLSKNDRRRYHPEQSYILIKLGKIYLKSKKFENAQACFRSAIQMLEIDHPQVVMREKLHLQLAKAFRKQGKKFSALKEARRSQICNPINERLGDVTGDIYRDLEKYRIALKEFYGALVWEPDNPEILIKIGECYLKRAVLCRDATDRTKALKKAKEHFERAWELYDKDKLNERTKARYLIAKTYMERCNYDEAMPHLRVIYNAMSSREKRITPKVLIVAIQLGLTYFKMRYFINNEKMFRDVLEKDRSYMKERVYSIGEMSLAEILARTHFGLASSFTERKTEDLERALKVVRGAIFEFNKLRESSIDEMSVAKIIARTHFGLASSFEESKTESGLEIVLKVVRNVIVEFNELREYSIDKMSLPGIMARAHIGLAYSFAERNTEICLDRALKEVRGAEGYINLLKFGDEKTKCQAMSSDCEGWIRYRQHQICDKKMAKMIKLECKELIELSIKHLESSVSIRVNSRGYLHLALAYKAKLEIKTEPERNILLQKAKVCCKLARDLDIKGEYDEELKDLERILVY